MPINIERICSVCGRTLSIYNPSKNCYMHNLPVDKRSEYRFTDSLNYFKNLILRSDKVER